MYEVEFRIGRDGVFRFSARGPGQYGQYGSDLSRTQGREHQTAAQLAALAMHRLARVHGDERRVEDDAQTYHAQCVLRHPGISATPSRPRPSISSSAGHADLSSFQEVPVINKPCETV